MSQYIGKTISLISNSNIRYVGTLHEINSEKSTVSLKQVRSYGTEGRRNGLDEIPPSEGVYEFIVFRGSDVKDLKIADNPPAPPPQARPFQDPAIIQSQTPQFQQPVHLSYPQNSTFPAPQNYSYLPPATGPPGQPAAPRTQSPFSPQQQKPATQPQPLQANRQPGGIAAPIPAVPVAQIPLRATSASSAAAAAVAASLAAVTPATTTAFKTDAKENDSTNDITKKDEIPRGPRSGPRRPSVPQGEFDFAVANAKFNKESIIPSAAEANDEFYNKKSSFFDNISSSAKEQTQVPGESSYQRRGEERKLNLETFGQASVYNRQGGGRGRGRAGFRGGRGGRGRGGYSNGNQFQQPS